MLHEATLSLFRDRPALAAELLTSLLATPVDARETISVLSADLGQIAPTELRADLVVRYDHVCVVVEVQLQPDPEKRTRWPLYVTSLHERLKCPVLLLVVAPRREVARWASKPIAVGGSFVLAPLVLGPDAIPRVSDHVTARSHLELAVLSTLVHAREADAQELASAAVRALLEIDDDRAGVYIDLILSAVSTLARRHLEAIMTQKYEYQSDFAKKYYGQGRAEGRAEGAAEGAAAARKGLHNILKLRGFTLTNEQRARIEAARLADLERWIDGAVTTESADALLES